MLKFVDPLSFLSHIPGIHIWLKAYDAYPGPALGMGQSCSVFSTWLELGHFFNACLNNNLSKLETFWPVW